MIKKIIVILCLVLSKEYAAGQSNLLDQALLKRLNNAILSVRESNQYFAAEIYGIYSVLKKDYVETMIEIENIYKKPYNQFLFFDYIYNKFNSEIVTDGRVLDRKYFLNSLFYKQLNLSSADTKMLTEYVDNGKYQKLKNYENGNLEKTVDNLVTPTFKLQNSITLPFKINQILFKAVSNENSSYSAITDTTVLNKLLTANLKNRLVSVNKNPILTEDYSFFNIGETAYKTFKIKIFIYQYNGEGLQLTAQLNVCDKSGKIIDTKEIGRYISTDFDSEETYSTIETNGWITLKTLNGKNSKVEKLFINAVGKILKS